MTIPMHYKTRYEWSGEANKGTLRYADPEIYFGLPDVRLVGSRYTLDQAARPTLERLKTAPFLRIKPPSEEAAPGAPASAPDASSSPTGARCSWRG